MKLNISIEQLQEITEEQKNKLRDMWEPKQFDVYIGHEYFNQISDMDDFMINGKSNYLPLLNIGQMIEMLGKEKTCECMYLEWSRLYGIELIDVLWSAVKSIL